MVRYILDNEIRHLYKDKDCREKITLPLERERGIVFLNILEQIEYRIKIRCYFSSGEIIEGWSGKDLFPVQLHNQEELFDGRFNA